MQRVSIGDISLAVRVEGSGEPLVLVHGFPLDHTMWNAQIERFASSHLVIAPDLRGFGQSDVTNGTVTMKQFADDIAALLDSLQVDKPITFCGLSMGGYVAWQFWRHHSSRLGKLILCDTRAIPDTTVGARSRRQLAETVLSQGPATLIRMMLEKLFHPPILEDKPEILEATRYVMESTYPEGIAAALRGMAERPDFTPELESIQTPALVICGEHDAISPSEEMRTFAKAMPNAQFVEIPGCGHMAPLEKPDEVNDAIAEFLAG